MPGAEYYLVKIECYLKERADYLENHVFDAEGFKIPYVIDINPRLKYARIGWDNGGMKISLPGRISAVNLERMLKSKEKWISEHYKNYMPYWEKSRRAIESGEKTLYKGEDYIIIIHVAYENKVKAEFDGNRFNIYLNSEIEEKDRAQIIRNVMRKLYINLARVTVNERLVYYSKIMNLFYKDVRIKEQKTRWGSCSKKGNLNFNWKLVMAPQWVMDYVIVHELSHLKFMNHSKDFWGMVSRYMPECGPARKWLKENGFKLQL